MNQIQDLTPASALIWIAIFLALLLAIAYLIVKTGKRNADQAADFEKKYAKIQRVIEDSQICEMNYDYSRMLLKLLEQHPGRNQEKIDVLDDAMRFRFEKIILQRRAEEQY